MLVHALHIGLLLFLVHTAYGQTFDLQPERWFPLELGNSWHYTSSDLFFPTEWMEETVRDTLVDGNRWTLIQTTTSEDTLSNPALISERYPLIVSVGTHPVYPVLDSTRLKLNVYAHVYFQGLFIYDIGQADGLIGARVNGQTYGDTRTLDSIRLRPESPDPTIATQLQAFPSPFSDHLTIQASLESAVPYELRVFDALGRIYLQRRGHAPTSSLYLNLPTTAWPPGVYMMQLVEHNYTIALYPSRKISVTEATFA